MLNARVLVCISRKLKYYKIKQITDQHENNYYCAFAGLIAIGAHVRFTGGFYVRFRGY